MLVKVLCIILCSKLTPLCLEYSAIQTQVRMHLACLFLVASTGLCLGESFIEEVPNHNEVLADRLALLEKKMLGLEEENKYLRLVFSCRSVLTSSFTQNKVNEDMRGSEEQPLQCDRGLHHGS